MSPIDDGPKFTYPSRGQQLNLLSTWLCMKHIIPLLCQYLQIQYFIFFYVSVFISQVNKENFRTLRKFTQLKILSHNFPLIFYFYFKDKFHRRSKIFSQRVKSCNIHIFILSRKNNIIHFPPLVIFSRVIKLHWHVSLFSYFL